MGCVERSKKNSTSVLKKDKLLGLARRKSKNYIDYEGS